LIENVVSSNLDKTTTETKNVLWTSLGASLAQEKFYLAQVSCLIAGVVAIRGCSWLSWLSWLFVAVCGWSWLIVAVRGCA